jgi:predicted Holliday junction resolvase-like endonuclease
VYDKVWKQWIHPSAVVMLTPEGKVARYFSELDYSPRDLRYGLIESSASRIGSPVDYLRFKLRRALLERQIHLCGREADARCRSVDDIGPAVGLSA